MQGFGSSRNKRVSVIDLLDADHAMCRPTTGINANRERHDQECEHSCVRLHHLDVLNSHVVRIRSQCWLVSSSNNATFQHTNNN
jgi:hypothetical protein